MKRRLFNLAAAVSLVMMPAVVALWVRSYWTSTEVYHSTFSPASKDSVLTNESITCVVGCLIWSKEHLVLHSPNGMAASADDGKYQLRHGTAAPVRSWRTLFHTLWFEVAWKLPVADTTQIMRQFAGASWSSYVRVPLWPGLVLSTILPAISAMRILRHRRDAITSLCSVCGYDLRATPDRCPECGTTSTSPAEL